MTYYVNLLAFLIALIPTIVILVKSIAKRKSIFLMDVPFLLSRKKFAIRAVGIALNFLYSLTLFFFVLQSRPEIGYMFSSNFSLRYRITAFGLPVALLLLFGVATICSSLFIFIKSVIHLKKPTTDGYLTIPYIVGLFTTAFSFCIIYGYITEGCSYIWSSPPLSQTRVNTFFGFVLTILLTGFVFLLVKYLLRQKGQNDKVRTVKIILFTVLPISIAFVISAWLGISYWNRKHHVFALEQLIIIFMVWLPSVFSLASLVFQSQSTELTQNERT